MPRPSACQVALRELRVVLDLRAEAAALRHFYDDEDLSEDGLDVLHAASYGRVLGSRYFDRPSSYRRRSDCWKNLLYETTLLNKDEFLEHFRLERVAFFRLVDLVRYHRALVSAGNCPFRGEAELHMLVLLKCLGSFGNDNTWSTQALFLGLGKGIIGDYLRRASATLLALETSTIAWPDECERSQISRRICRKMAS
ncbi:hypothetical protein PC129_g20213 [Phytophthora cactorum]|uniref:Uncharacterized protein n=1 Tax=Phytophthora cactorum TaxID=29920 RepID=A0A329RPM8_9STRA|nr:hypothetical protein Pcac1_g7134 [Phytophthora cactorum]KAG2794118.1 hypothetical protein PC111_g22741 [Phytophthora cactorum]KAG2801807.1 hypothetical protein PC112_g19888 [Phytophthora cactorum]KAG2837880.1 hypothetical protein PC113_g19754 [Phytophthora cactorum]KAG2881199.1 hypothetical protein PC114_g21681 [Phytophthora cactorum]